MPPNDEASWAEYRMFVVGALEDIQEHQKNLEKEISELREQIGGLKTRVGVIAGGISLIVPVAMFLLKVIELRK